MGIYLCSKREGTVEWRKASRDIVRREKHRWNCGSKYRSKVSYSSLLPVPSEKMCPKAELKGDGKRNNIIS